VYDTGNDSEEQCRPKEASVERLCITFEIAPGTEEEYKKRHDEIWPELVAAIKEAGFSNYTLFRRGTQVVGYAECEPDVATALGRLGPQEVNERWAKWFLDDGVIVTGEDGEWLQTAEEVWHLD
jgi:L-rhamnose mutarotase